MTDPKKNLGSCPLGAEILTWVGDPIQLDAKIDRSHPIVAGGGVAWGSDSTADLGLAVAGGGVAWGSDSTADLGLAVAGGGVAWGAASIHDKTIVADGGGVAWGVVSTVS